MWKLRGTVPDSGVTLSDRQCPPPPLPHSLSPLTWPIISQPFLKEGETSVRQSFQSIRSRGKEGQARGPDQEGNERLEKGSESDRPNLAACFLWYFRVSSCHFLVDTMLHHFLIYGRQLWIRPSNRCGLSCRVERRRMSSLVGHTIWHWKKVPLWYDGRGRGLVSSLIMAVPAGRRRKSLAHVRQRHHSQRDFAPPTCVTGHGTRKGGRKRGRKEGRRRWVRGKCSGWVLTTMEADSALWIFTWIRRVK